MSLEKSVNCRKNEQKASCDKFFKNFVSRCAKFVLWDEGQPPFVFELKCGMRCGRKTTPRTRNLLGEFAAFGMLTLNRPKVKSFLPLKFEPKQTKKKDTSKPDSACL